MGKPKVAVIGSLALLLTGVSLLLSWNMIPIPSARAAEPPAGTLSDAAMELNWVGRTILSAPVFDPASCQVTQSCDVFTLTVNVSDAYRTANPNFVVFIRIDWGHVTDDFDLHVRKEGQAIADSAQQATNFEEVRLDQPANGRYEIFTHSFASVPNTRYSGKATLLPHAPPLALRAGIYLKDPDGKFGPQMFQFTSDLRLIAGDGLSGQDSEPSIEINPFGTIYTAAIQGVPAGTDFWRSRDDGQTFDYLGQPDGVASEAESQRRIALGGGDDTISLGAPSLGPDVPLGGSTGRVYVSSLWLGSVTLANSSDEGDSFQISQTPVPLVDRQWTASAGAARLYLASRQLGALIQGTTSLTIVQSDDGGLTYPRGAFITTPLIAPRERLQGNLVAYPRLGNDPTNSTIYNVFSGSSRRDLYIAKCPAPCRLPLLVRGLVDVTQRPFSVQRIFLAPPGATVDNVFPVMTVDNAGGLHVTFSDKRRVFLMSSADGGNTWTDPVQVNNPDDAETATALFPWVFAGDSGRVGIMWYGTDRVGNSDSEEEFRGAEWKIFYAMTPNAFAQAPTFNYVVASGTTTGNDQQQRGVVHVGSICTQGLACDTSTPPGNRNLGEYSSFTANPNGQANIVYGGDVNTPNGKARTHFTKQTAGETLLGNPVASGGGFIGRGKDEKNLSLRVYSDLSGDLNYLDSAACLHLKADRFASANQMGNQVTLSGMGTLQDGSAVSFTVVIVERGKSDHSMDNFAIYLSTGYTAAGALQGGNVKIQ